MTRGLYVRTKEIRKKISEAKKGKPSGMLGKRHSGKTKEKIRKAMKGRLTPWLKGKTGNNKGKHWKVKDTSKMSQARMGNTHGFQKGIKHFNWRGGRSNDTSFYKRRRRLSELYAGGFHTLAEWLHVKEKNKFKCLHCKKSEPEIKLTRDHIIPITKKGSDNIENIQPLCQSCNSKKGTKTNKIIL